MPRTTLDLEASALAGLRLRAARQGKSMGRLASELLAQQLTGDSPASESEALQWITRDLGIPRQAAKRRLREMFSEVEGSMAEELLAERRS